ncbi:MAG TPA: restriction endonuclease, partial [Tepidiformaceae bacterium]|nr:restriction endonuclease [Tepidiformaceae bacterium]
MLGTDGPRVWVVRGGDNNELAAQVKLKQAVGIGWDSGGSASGLSREELRLRMEQASPGSGTGNAVGQLFRFVNDIQIGDYVLTPEKANPVIHVSQCAGGYVFDASVFGESYPHVRKVDYRKAVPRDTFSVSVRNTLGSLLTVFRVDSAVPYLDLGPGIVGASAPLDRDDATLVEPGVWADEIDAAAKGQILEALDNIEHYYFQIFVCGLLEAMGYRTRVGGKGADGGVDLLAYKDAFGLENPRIKGQTKNQKSTAGFADVGYLNGILGPNESGLFVCTGGFSKDALNASFVKSGRVALVDGRELLGLLLEHYDKLSD